MLHDAPSFINVRAAGDRDFLRTHRDGVNPTGSQLAIAPVDRDRLLLLALFCAPSLFTAATLALDAITRSAFGESFTSGGFVGGLVGLAAFFLGYVSILAWPGVVVLSLKAIRKAALSRMLRGVVIFACLVATYSAVFFLVWFVIVPLGGTWQTNAS